MDRGLQRIFNRLERQKDAVLRGVADWPPERLRFRPAPGAWSTLDVLDHLVKVEVAGLSSIRANLPNGMPVHTKDRLGSFMVNMAMRLPTRVKVPTGAHAVLPDTAAELAVVVENWRRARERMHGLLSSLSGAKLRCGVFSHPIGGAMTIATALTFFSTHMRHHEYQLKRLKDAIKDGRDGSDK